MYKAGVIGDKNSVMGFLSLGLTVEYANNPKDALKKLDNLIEMNCAVIFITEELYLKMDLSEFNKNVTTAIIPIPGNKGSLGVGRSKLKRAVEKAVGADIIFKD